MFTRSFSFLHQKNRCVDNSILEYWLWSNSIRRNKHRITMFQKNSMYTRHGITRGKRYRNNKSEASIVS